LQIANIWSVARIETSVTFAWENPLPAFICYGITSKSLLSSKKCLTPTLLLSLQQLQYELRYLGLDFKGNLGQISCFKKTAERTSYNWSQNKSVSNKNVTF